MWNLIIFLLAAAVVAALFRAKLPHWTGAAGERFVSRKLHQLDADHYKILNDLLLPSNGHLDTTQIDHIVVSNYGIFCIETKAYEGWIFGDASQEYWIQVIYRHKERFYNPLRQNYAHVKAVEELVRSKYPNAQIYSLVAFPDADKLKISGTDLVGFTSDVVRKIKNYTSAILSGAEKDEIYKMLVGANIQDKHARKLHDQAVRELKR
ncbi:NERD domain-containing protein [bacterium]|nr:MAG: NERD domain-containing protein [bacterium]